MNNEIENKNVHDIGIWFFNVNAIVIVISGRNNGEKSNSIITSKRININRTEQYVKRNREKVLCILIDSIIEFIDECVQKDVFTYKNVTLKTKEWYSILSDHLHNI